MPSPWSDWFTHSFFRIRISRAAAVTLHALPWEVQLRLRRMLQDVSELADLMPPTAAQALQIAPPLMQLQVGRVSLRYSIAEEPRTLSVEHVTEERELDRAG